MPIHKVKQGEQISGITALYGFSDYKLIWDHANNAKLKQKRDPHVLFPGDEIYVPQKILKIEEGATTKVHTFEIKEVPLYLRIRAKDIDYEPVPKAPYKMSLDDKQNPKRSGSLDGDGILTEKISVDVLDGTLAVTVAIPPPKDAEIVEFVDLKYDLKVGYLNPKTTLSGQQARLNNMGYFAGFSVEDTEQMRWAIEEFQCERMGMKPVKKVPVITPESEDPFEETGVQDKATQDAIEKEHGI
jgi:hypothetical protein